MTLTAETRYQAALTEQTTDEPDQPALFPEHDQENP